jgi:hypothetical protein
MEEGPVVDTWSWTTLSSQPTSTKLQPCLGFTVS